MTSRALTARNDADSLQRRAIAVHQQQLVDQHSRVATGATVRVRSTNQKIRCTFFRYTLLWCTVHCDRFKIDPEVKCATTTQRGLP